MTINMQNKSNPSLYIHIPFCKQRCNYCAFYSQCDDSSLKSYLNAIINESSLYKNVTVKSVFIGGGTPSLINGNDFKFLISEIKKNINIEKDAEFTLEANPESFSFDNAINYAKAGVNRFSFGFQSADEKSLRFLNRIHNFDDCIKAVEIARSCCVNNINADLIIGTPGESLVQLSNTLERVVSLNLKHISLYSLSVEEDTPLYNILKERNITIDEDFERDCYDYAKDFLEKKGYIRYEVSNFAQKGFESRHNYGYWDYSPYIGLGAAAHSFYNGYRYSNIADLQKYLADPLHANTKKQFIPIDEAKGEYIMLALRTDKGMNVNEFNTFFNGDFLKEYDKVLNKQKSVFIFYEKEKNLYITLKKEFTYIQNIILSDFI